MAFNYEYPYTDPDRYNDDWLLNSMKDLKAQWENWKASNQVTFGGKWAGNLTYLKDTIVYSPDGTNFYIALQNVPAGIQLDNTDYWEPVLFNLPYVTPEMYGAKGDGVTDDSAALQDMFNSTYKLIIAINSYYSASQITVNHNVNYIGNGNLRLARGMVINSTDSHFDLANFILGDSIIINGSSNYIKVSYMTPITLGTVTAIKVNGSGNSIEICTSNNFHTGIQIGSIESLYNANYNRIKIGTIGYCYYGIELQGGNSNIIDVGQIVGKNRLGFGIYYNPTNMKGAYETRFRIGTITDFNVGIYFAPSPINCAGIIINAFIGNCDTGILQDNGSKSDYLQFYGTVDLSTDEETPGTDFVLYGLHGLIVSSRWNPDVSKGFIHPTTMIINTRTQWVKLPVGQDSPNLSTGMNGVLMANANGNLYYHDAEKWQTISKTDL